MTVIAIVALAIGIASGLYLIGRAVLVPKTFSFTELHKITSGEGVSVTQALQGSTVQNRRSKNLANNFGETLIRVTTQSRIGKALGLRTVEQLTADLKILDKTVESHITTKLIGAIAGFGLPVLGASILTIGGLPTPVIPVAFVAVVLAIGGFLFPEWTLADDLTKRRLDFRHAFSSYMDFVTIYHAGSYGIRDALIQASEASDGWAFERIRAALIEARHRHQAEAEALQHLGHQLDIAEVVDFAKAVNQTASKGALIQDTLISKSNMMRQRLAGEAEASAASGNEKMVLALAMFVLGLLLFIGFGALNSTEFVSDENPPTRNSTN